LKKNFFIQFIENIWNEIEEMLSSGQKEKYRIEILPSPGKTEDQLNLGYVKLGSL